MAVFPLSFRSAGRTRCRVTNPRRCRHEHPPSGGSSRHRRTTVRRAAWPARHGQLWRRRRRPEPRAGSRRMQLRLARVATRALRHGRRRHPPPRSHEALPTCGPIGAITPPPRQWPTDASSPSPGNVRTSTHSVIVDACLRTTLTELRHPLASQRTVPPRHRQAPRGQAPARRTRGRTRTDPSRMGEAARSSRDHSRNQARGPIRDGRHLASHRDRVPGRDPAPKPPLCPPVRAERRSRLPSQFPRQPPQALQQSLHSTRTSSLQSSQSQPQHWICTTAQRNTLICRVSAAEAPADVRH
jgi:hypothetical protein